MATLDNAAVEKELVDGAVRNRVNRIFKDNRLQAEYAKRMQTPEKPKFTIEQQEKVTKVNELSARFFGDKRLLHRRALEAVQS